MSNFSLPTLFHSTFAEQARAGKSGWPRLLPIATALCVGAIFVADTAATTDIAFCTLYTVVVLMTARFCSAWGTVRVAIGCVALTILTYYLSPPSGPEYGGIVNTAIGVAAIGLTTFLVVQQKAAEASLHEAERRLRQAEKMSALGQLAGGMAHDFRNVLQMVQGRAELIAQCPGEEERVRRLTGAILSAVERGIAITRRLLVFARSGELRAAPIDAAALLSEMQEILGHSLGGAIALRIEAAAGLPPMLADKGELETVLINLAANARDAMPGGGTLSLTAAPETVASVDGARHPPSLKPGRYLRLCVADTGSGMDATTLARAGEPFFTTKPAGKGTGLGLPMAQGFAEQSGGGLRIESAPGQGTTVTLWLPVAREVWPHQATPGQRATGPGSGSS